MDSTTPRSRGGLFAVALAVAVAGAAFLGAGQASAATPNFGSNVIVLNPTMPQAAIQTQLDAVSTQQVPNQFGTQRYSILFQPGTYGSAASPLVFQLGYYTQVAGLGAQPGDVVINGAIDVFNQCTPACEGLNNFWRSVSNLTLNVHLPALPPAWAPNPGEDAGCMGSNDLFAVSQASPVRRVIVNGNLFLQDYCGEGFTSGGFFADDEFNGGIVCDCTQQQYFTRNSNIDFWTNSVWNQVFLGDVNAPPQAFGAGVGQYTTLPATPVSREAPFLYTDAGGNYNVFVPAVQHNSVGPSYAAGPAAGSSIPISSFFIASPSTPVIAIDAALLLGKNLILTPGIYKLDLPIVVIHPDTIVLGLGFATLIPQHGSVAIQTANVPGIKLSGLIVDAGPQNSPALVQLGTCDFAKSRAISSSQCVGPALPAFSNPNDPTLVQDVFFRIGGAAAGKATNSLIVNTNNSILDDVWAWRADHGTGVGWTSNTADTGLIVNGDNVNAYGLFVEHYQKNEVIWNGQNGEDVFFQNEMPYDPPSQAAWMSSPTTQGYPAFLVSSNVTSFQGYGMGSYSFFNQGVPIFATQAFQSPTNAGVQFHDLLTVFLDKVHGSGGISSVINGVGGSSTAANADVPVDVVSYP
jgi:hypothetical protein